MESTDFLHSTKAAAATALASIGAGLAFTLDIIPDDIIKLSTLLGSILSAILIYNHIRSKNLSDKYLDIKLQADRLEKLQRELLLATARNEALTEVLGNIVNADVKKLKVLKP